MKHSYLFVIFLLLTGFGNLYAQKHPKEAIDLAQQAQSYYDKTDYKNALNYYLEAEKIQPKDPQFSYSIASCYIKLGYYEEALPYLIVARDAKLKAPHLDYDLGVTYHSLLKFDDAITAFESYLHHNHHHKKTPEELKKTQDYIRFSKNGKELVKNPVNVKITNLGEKINSQHPDYNPNISADETMLIFTSRRENTTGGKRDPIDNNFYEDIYITVRSDKNQEWTTPSPLSNVINTENHDANVGLSADGQKLFIYKPDNGGDLYISNLIGTIWSEPKNLGTNINSSYWEPCASISADGKTLFFVSNRGGNNDIYISQKQANGEFGMAKKLSGKVNTTYDEFSPFIHPDGKTLYFSSTGYNSMGGYDIFSCTINLETGDVITDPVNVGYPINTADDDIYFVWSADNKRAYFSSIRGNGSGEKDLYMLEKEDAMDVSLLILKGKVINCDTKEPVQATISITDNISLEQLGTYTSNSTTGKFILALPGGKSYGIDIDAPGFVFYSKDLVVSKKEKYHEMEDTICLHDLKIGTTLTFRNILFENNSAEIVQNNSEGLQTIYNILHTNHHLKLSINVHTDSDGDDQANLKLTEERSKSIKNYLVSKGIDSKRIFYKGSGETKPLVPNDNSENKNLNKRVEVEILK